MTATKPRPLSITPRLLRRGLAAEYLGMSVGSFDKLVRAGVIPPPKRLDNFKEWDRRDLDAFVEQLPYDGPAGGPDDTWN